MKVRVAALGDPDNLVHVQWPHEWRIPVAGDHLVLPDVDRLELEVAYVAVRSLVLAGLTKTTAAPRTEA